MKNLAAFFLMFLIALSVYSQNTIKGTSPVYQFNITKEVKPPVLNMDPASLTFIDQNGNHAIDANESCAIRFSLENSGFGDGLGLKVKVSATGNTEGISFDESASLAVVKVGEKKTIEIPLKSNLNTMDGLCYFYSTG